MSASETHAAVKLFQESLAALADPALHGRLALFDLLRGGRLREREWAQSQLEAAL